jgi:lipopolysaccharide transport system ATP-binding protein
VAALLELGIGFHAEFTGRQNAIMAGQLLGISGAEMLELMPEIEAFADIGAYFDQPVRVYSSGMHMRLAFSVATARRPDILIVDEALSVGDAFFQHKSFERIRQFRKQGTTLLIVSHDKAAIQAICDHAILLNAGRLSVQGLPEAVLNHYNALLTRNEPVVTSAPTRRNAEVKVHSGSGEARVSEVTLRSDSGEMLQVVSVGTPVVLQIKVRIHAPIPFLVLGYLFKDRLGQALFGTNTFQLGKPLTDLGVHEELTFQFRFEAALGPGTYSISTALANSELPFSKNYEWRDGALFFQVVNTSKPNFVGNIYLPTTQSLIRTTASHG